MSIKKKKKTRSAFFFFNFRGEQQNKGSHCNDGERMATVGAATDCFLRLVKVIAVYVLALKFDRFFLTPKNRLITSSFEMTWAELDDSPTGCRAVDGNIGVCITKRKKKKEHTKHTGKGGRREKTRNTLKCLHVLKKGTLSCSGEGSPLVGMQLHNSNENNWQSHLSPLLHLR